MQALRESPAAGFYEALENVKGVQMTTSSLTFKVPNTRGFNSPNNFRFMQLTDGVDMQAATLGVPLGNAIGATEPDIESVEITPGAASALYGMNALNGLASLQTKSPFKYPGLSVYQKVGVNHVDGRDHAPALLTETALRLARVVGKKWAFKLNASYLHGTDWRSGNATDQNPQPAAAANPAFAALSGAANPAADYWNRYGDENNNSVPVTIPYQGKNQTFNIRRTGYWETDLVSPSVENLKFDAGLYVVPKKGLELAYTYRVGRMDGIFQRGNKIRLDGVVVQNHKLEVRSPRLTWRAYVLSENTGRSYNLKPLADNLDLNNGSNTVWGNRFRTELLEQLTAGQPLAAALSLIHI